MKKILTLVLALILAMSAAAFAETSAVIPFEPTLEFSYMYPVPAFYSEDNMFDPYLDEALNTHIEWMMIPTADFEQKLSVVLSSGELPDVIRVSKVQLDSLIGQGAVLPLDEMMETYGADIAAKYDEWNAWPSVYNVDDGHIYGVFGIEEVATANCLAIRQDWLDKLGLDTPVTLDEWISALYAFKENNLGGEFTYPVGNTVYPFFDAYGIKYTTDYRYVITDDNEIVCRYEHEHYLEALELLVKMYQDGIINPYIFSQASTDLDMAIYNGYIGMVEHTGNQIGLIWNAEMEKDIEGAWFEPVPPIVGPYGDQTARGRAGVASSCSCITVAAKDPERILQYLNWLYSEEGQIAFNYGIEGTTFDWVEGKPMLRVEYCDAVGALWPAGVGCVYKGAMVWRNDQFGQLNFGGKTKDQMDKYQLCSYKAYMEVNEGHLHTTYTQFTTPTENELGSELWSTLKNAEQQCIAGVITIDEFKETLAGVKAAGMDTIMEEARGIWAKLNNN